jgi:RNA polymerase sigma-70 factor (ECF subfamily)
MGTKSNAAKSERNSEHIIADVTEYKQSDEALMALYALGDAQAFEVLYHRHKGGLYRYFMRQMANHSLAEDLYQDIWSKVIGQSHQYKPSAKFTTWLYTLAHNKLVDHVRHLSVVNKVLVNQNGQKDQVDEKPENAIENMAESNTNSQPDKQYANSSDGQSLNHCISQLPQGQKECFLLKEETGLTVKDIAVVLGTNLEASKSRLRYAYENLRQCLHIKLGRDLL